MSEVINSKETQRKRVTGKVVSNKMQNTIVVLVVRQVQHPKYNKYITRNTKLCAHDDTGNVKEGDTVIIEECRPLSKTKSWRLIKVVE